MYGTLPSLSNPSPCRYGWGWKNMVAEANTGKGLKMAGWMRWYVTYILPLIVAFILCYGLITFFK